MASAKPYVPPFHPALIQTFPCQLRPSPFSITVKPSRVCDRLHFKRRATPPVDGGPTEILQKVCTPRSNRCSQVSRNC
jgi:hypothetical protein